MTEDIVKRAKAIVERFQSGCESPPVNPIILDLIAEIEHLREQTDWQHKNALKWRETCDDLEDEKNQWKGRYLELKENYEGRMTDEDREEIIDLDAELTAKDTEIERLRSREVEFAKMSNVVSEKLKQFVLRSAEHFSAVFEIADQLVDECEKQSFRIKELEAAFLENQAEIAYYVDQLPYEYYVVYWEDQIERKKRIYREYTEKSAREEIERIKKGEIE